MLLEIAIDAVLDSLRYKIRTQQTFATTDAKRTVPVPCPASSSSLGRYCTVMEICREVAPNQSKPPATVMPSLIQYS